MSGSPRTLIRSSPNPHVPEIDLTNAHAQELPPFSQSDTPFPSSPFPTMPRGSPGHFNSALRRVYTRRERLYDRERPNMMRERLDMAEECAAPELHPARQSALTHLSRAYAIAGYAQSALVVAVSAVLTAFLVSFARGLLADVSRKTRLRASGAVRAAVSCRLDYDQNGCAGVDSITPALKNLCEEWLACIGREKTAMADAVSATVWAEAIAETFNAFAERISSTTVAIGVTMIVVLMFCMSSAAFGFMHRRLVDDRLATPQQSPAPSSLAVINDKPYRSPYTNSGLRPRAISFDPNNSPTVVKN